MSREVYPTDVSDEEWDLALPVSPANEQERAQVGALAKQVQEATQRSVRLAYVNQGYAGEKPAAEAEAHGIHLEVAKLAETKRGFVLLPRRWVVERSFVWLARFRRLSRDYKTTSNDTGRIALAGFYQPFTQQLVQDVSFKFMTGSKQLTTPRRPAIREIKLKCVVEGWPEGGKWVAQ